MALVRVASLGNLMLLFFLHFLGGSAREWTPVIERLSGRFRCLAIDLPGFGDAAEMQGYAVTQMADAAIGTIRSHAPAEWLLVGHSMGAKVAAAIARRSEDGDQGLSGLRGLVLLAGSPPSPEPMAESRRKNMQGWFVGNAEQSREEARSFIESNTAGALEPGLLEATVSEVLRMKRAAWLAWLSDGSREDWSKRIGVLRTPALILAGERDEDLGAEAQRCLMMPHFAQSRLRVVAKARHLLPLEQPDEVAALIAEHTSVEHAASLMAAAIDPDYLALIESGRVSDATRAALLARAEPDDAAYSPQTLSVEQLALLRAVLQRVLPQPTDASIDLAARLDRQLAAGKGDGWRYALLPADAEAYRTGLETLDELARQQEGHPFLALDAEKQDRILAKAAEGPERLMRWFEDLRADAVKLYLAHPATLARLGYSGIADGGQTASMRGFVRLGMGERESWEPTAKAKSSR
jgi:pimeloyl-ACP methyl ester carboxylesterase